jgi:TatD DNase family protein
MEDVEMRDPTIVDTHAHLCSSAFDRDLSEVLERARASGVAAVVSVSEGLAESERNLELAGKHPMLLPAAGLFPSHPDMNRAAAVAALIRRERHRIRAVGEVGLDYWIAQEEKDRALQRDVLCLFVDLSRDLELPLNVHSRSAGRRVIELLLERGAERVQLHAFDGKASRAAPAVEAGYFFSIPPSVVRSPQKQKLVRSLPLENLLVETDSPVLGPNREGRNEPANALIVIRAIAQLKNLLEEEVLEAVLRNTAQLYGPIHR